MRLVERLLDLQLLRVDLAAIARARSLAERAPPRRNRGARGPEQPVALAITRHERLAHLLVQRLRAPQERPHRQLELGLLARLAAHAAGHAGRTRSAQHHAVLPPA